MTTVWVGGGYSWYSTHTHTGMILPLAINSCDQVSVPGQGHVPSTCCSPSSTFFFYLIKSPTLSPLYKTNKPCFISFLLLHLNEELNIFVKLYPFISSLTAIAGGFYFFITMFESIHYFIHYLLWDTDIIFIVTRYFKTNMNGVQCRMSLGLMLPRLRLTIPLKRSLLKDPMNQ